MEQELLNTFDKELLLKDLCARLPYGIKCEYDNLRYGGVFKVTDIRYNGYIDGVIDNKRCWAVFEPLELKPYLFPLSSMTEEQKEEYVELQQRVIYNGQSLVNLDVMKYVDWCYKNHIDINSLIPMSLAIDATGLNIY